MKDTAEDTFTHVIIYEDRYKVLLKKFGGERFSSNIHLSNISAALTLEINANVKISGRRIQIFTIY